MYVILLLLMQVFVSLARATTFTVTSTRDDLDVAPGDGICATSSAQCTLRAAVEEANAQGDANMVILPAGRFILARKGTDDDARAGDLDVLGTLTVIGAGARRTEIDGQRAKDRIFEVHPGGSLDLSGVTLRGGQARGPEEGGGGIRVLGSLVLHDATVTGCRSRSDAGAIDVQQAVATLTDVKLLHNRAGDDGGAMDIDGGTATLLRVVVADNRAADEGGGLENSGGNVALHQVRITRNRARTDAGGLSIEDAATTVLEGCAITRNRAKLGGGIFTDDREHGASTTLISGTTLRGNTHVDCAGPLVDGGRNLGDPSCAFTP